MFFVFFYGHLKRSGITPQLHIIGQITDKQKTSSKQKNIRNVHWWSFERTFLPLRVSESKQNKKKAQVAWTRGASSLFNNHHCWWKPTWATQVETAWPHQKNNHISRLWKRLIMTRVEVSCLVATFGYITAANEAGKWMFGLNKHQTFTQETAAVCGVKPKVSGQWF